MIYRKFAWTIYYTIYTRIQLFYIIYVSDVPNEGPELIPEAIKMSSGAELRAVCLGPDTPHHVNLSFYVNGVRVSERLQVREPQQENARARARLAMPTEEAMFKEGRLRLRCLATMWTLYRRTVETSIFEEAPHVAMVINPTHGSGVATPYHHYEGILLYFI